MQKTRYPLSDMTLVASQLNTMWYAVGLYWFPGTMLSLTDSEGRAARQPLVLPGRENVTYLRQDSPVLYLFESY